MVTVQGPTVNNNIIILALTLYRPLFNLHEKYTCGSDLEFCHWYLTLMGNVMLHHNRSSQKHINHTPNLSKILLQNTNLKGDLWTCYLAKTLASQKVLTKWLKPGHIIRKRHDLKKKKKILWTHSDSGQQKTCNVLGVTHTDQNCPLQIKVKLSQKKKHLGTKNWKEKQVAHKWITQMMYSFVCDLVC